MTSDGTHTYQYDAEGRLKSIDNGATATSTFNALGLRVYRITSGGSVSYWHDIFDQGIGGAFSGGGSNAFIPFGGRLLADYEYDGIHFAHANSLGSTTQTTNWAGGGVQEVTFYPWGRIWNQTPGYFVHQLFASLQDYDPGMDQYQTPNRAYPPILGRWMTPDPAGMAAANPANPQSWNRYAYVLNNPANLTDPTGLFEGCTNTPDPEACVQGFNPPPSSCIDPNDLFCNEGNPDPFFLPDGGGGGGGGGGGSSGGGGGTVGGGGGTPTILAATASTGEGVIDLSGTLLKVISRACGWNPVCIDILLGGASVDPEVAAGVVIAGVAIYKGVQAGVQIY